MTQGKSIRENALAHCNALVEVKIPTDIVLIGNYAFHDCKSLTKVEIPLSVITIGDYVFSECISLTQITIPSSVRSIGNYAFSSCTSLTQITLPSSVEYIGDGILANCSNLRQIINDQDARFKFIQDEYLVFKSSPNGNYDTLIFAKPNIRIAEIPQTIKTIKGGAFYKCESLEHITIPTSVTTIGSSQNEISS